MIDVNKLNEIYEQEYTRQLDRNAGHMTVKGDPHLMGLLAVYDFGYEDGFMRAGARYMGDEK